MQQTPTMLAKQRRLIGIPRSAARVAAFTLIELLVVIAILTVLISIILASLVQVRVSAKSFVCKNQLKTVAFSFIQFADDYAHPWRGDSDLQKRPGFSLQDFQEHLYGVSEFCKLQSASGLPVPYKPSDQPLVCPCGPQELGARADKNLSLEDAVVPNINVSIGFNLRLYWTGQVADEPFDLTKRIMEHAAVPLAFDVDGEQAEAAGVVPFYSAPRVSASGAWPYWFPPARRHGKHINVAFVGGHVLSSSHADTQGGWDWKYLPPH